MVELTALLGVAALAHGIAYYLKVPPVPFLLLGGVALGLAGFLADPDYVEDVLLLALTLLLFIAGSDLSVRRVGEYKRLAAKIGAVQFVALAGLGLGLAVLLGYVLIDALYLALALAASSTLVVMRLLAKRRQTFEPFGRVTTGVLLLQDLLIVVMIPVVTLLPDGGVAVAAGVGGTALLLGLTYLMVQYIAPFLIVRLELDTESLLLVVVSVLFAFMGAAYLLSVPLIAAAFLAGVSLSGFPVSNLVHGELRPIADFFIAIFFTALGTAIVAIDLTGFFHALLFAALVVIVTPPLVTLIAERAGLSARSSLESGLLLSQTSEFSLLVGLQGLLLGQISQSLFTIIALTTVLTMILTPILSSERVVWRLIRLHPLRTRGRPKRIPRNHVLLLGGSETVLPLLETLHLSGEKVLVVDEDPGIVSQLRAEDIACMRGDVGDPEVLKAAGATTARIIISTISRPRSVRPVFDLAREAPVLVRVFEKDEEEQVKKWGGTPISFSDAAAEDVLQWFDQQQAHDSSAPAPA